MPEMQPIEPAGSGQNPAAMVSTFDDDYPLGCECADPALQIERWQLEAAGLTGEAS